MYGFSNDLNGVHFALSISPAISNYSQTGSSSPDGFVDFSMGLPAMESIGTVRDVGGLVASIILSEKFLLGSTIPSALIVPAPSVAIYLPSFTNRF